jgi:hypothetical protein
MMLPVYRLSNRAGARKPRQPSCRARVSPDFTVHSSRRHESFRHTWSICRSCTVRLEVCEQLDSPGPRTALRSTPNSQLRRAQLGPACGRQPAQPRVGTAKRASDHSQHITFPCAFGREDYTRAPIGGVDNLSRSSTLGRAQFRWPESPGGNHLLSLHVSNRNLARC